MNYELVDGSRRGQETTAGGVVRDSNGDFVIVFAVKLNHDDSLQAELEAIRHGLWIFKEHHLVNIEVESDCEMACRMIGNGLNASWRYVHLVRKIRSLMEDGGGIRHIYRQCNKVADGFATLAYGLNATPRKKSAT